MFLSRKNVSVKESVGDNKISADVAKSIVDDVSITLGVFYHPHARVFVKEMLAVIVIN